MAKRIFWSRQAVADLIQILDYWYQRLGSKEYPSKLNKGFKVNFIYWSSSYGTNNIL